MSITKREQLENTREKNGGTKSNIGTTYRVSGNLLIAIRTCKTVPRLFLGCARSNIVAFSHASGLRMRRYLRECLSEYKQMVTLTYPCGYPSDGAIVKEHLRRFLQELKRDQARHNLVSGSSEIHSSFWFLEFQERGAPHFHIFTTYANVPRGTNNWVAETWYRIVNSEDIRHLQAGTRTEFLRAGRAGTISYAAKYAVKQYQKAVPENYENVGRFWGISGRRSVMSAATYVSRADAAKSDIKKTLNAMNGYVKKHIEDGQVEVYKREDGVFIAYALSAEVCRRLRGYVGLLSAKTMIFEQLFDSAEILE